MSAVSLWLLAAVLMQGALALGLIWYLGAIRLPLIANGKVRIREIALSRDPWPEREKQVSNAFDNQFQLPVLFYVAALCALYLGAGIVEALLAWAFVITRYVHAFIHVTDNNVVRRFWVYTAGLTVLCLSWLVLVIRLLGVATAGGA